MNVPKLQKENLKIAMNVVEFLKRNPGAIKSDVDIAMGRTDYRFHPQNFENIYKFLFGMNFIKKVKTKYRVHYFLKTQDIPKDILDKGIVYTQYYETKE